jgi:hypothetical protein
MAEGIDLARPVASEIALIRTPEPPGVRRAHATGGLSSPAMGALTTFRTEGCTQHGHPEFALQLGKTVVPGIERMLLSYLEGAVARGTRFEPGQTIQIGWGTLRVIARRDGALGLEERVDPETWAETVDRTLHQTWYQKEVASSLGLAERLQFPRQDHAAMVSKCAMEASSWLLTRLEADDARFSGWSIACTEDHDHGDRAFPPLLAVVMRLPFVTQFLALPPGAAVLVMGPGRIRAHAWLDGKELTPVAGSYLAALNGAQ